ncbi:precorrin-6y C5,15-methyltransferase (decarboxylating) subunit CbiE [Roseofilum casamattae]|uniref:tRNA (guanine(46)-N(7))-methyltransferase n=1 Tax=Roseofilum casamattae BLCC-M143 TaxID=3022442 RepID=A0ABT7BU90_9CYAN|nr:precorrin-6y C5,15-methyltransferase (decarboxylating) subunit CbiE [Roseofilum casamattae]MDJ1182756.1 precorrin-6y C5,15-methyltransferase (decarboxylating) subunit CbiE [Roseofilum casamattae BLCC-M143]
MIDAIGVGLDGASGLSAAARRLISEATVLVGSDRHLNYFAEHPAKRLVLNDISQTFQQISNCLDSDAIVILVSGDPLFFGLGRLLLGYFPAEQLRFHPHVSSIQLAFSRLKLPWQDARTISVHGRSFDRLVELLQKGESPIAVLTDPVHSPSAIAHLLQQLDLPSTYQLYICENLGGMDERIHTCSWKEAIGRTFAALNVTILVRQPSQPSTASVLPIIGIPDGQFYSFADRPGLITKREVRLLILGELGLSENQTIWDIGAGTGSVAVEMARLSPTSRIYAIEKTAAGIGLIEQNARHFQVSNIISIQGMAPQALRQIPPPDRVFIGGTGDALSTVLACAVASLLPGGKVVMALATVEHLHEAIAWLNRHNLFYRLLQVQLSRSIPVGRFTRYTPLNPVTILTIGE